jgi:hypothetical protein
VLIAAVGQGFFAGPAGIGAGMAVVIGVCCPLGAASLALGCKAMREAVREAETSMPDAS